MGIAPPSLKYTSKLELLKSWSGVIKKKSELVLINRIKQLLMHSDDKKKPFLMLTLYSRAGGVLKDYLIMG